MPPAVRLHQLITLLVLGIWLTPLTLGQTFPTVLSDPVEIIPSSTVTGDQFGAAVAAEMNLIAVGAPFASSGRGAVVLQEYDGSNWTQVAALAPSGLTLGAQFGRALALDGDTLAVGAPDVNFPVTGIGAVYIYIDNGSVWTLEATLAPSAGLPGDQFGRSLALQADRLVVGAPFDDDGGVQSGSAFVFDRSGNTWTETAQLLPADPAPGAQFGKSVALDGDTALIGAWLDSGTAIQAGAAYAFVETTGVWSEQAKLVPATVDAGDAVGETVGLSGDIALLGAPNVDDDSGAIFQFERAATLWTEATFEVPFSITDGDNFARSLSLLGNLLLVGAPDEDSQGTAKGTVFFFELNQSNTFELHSEIDNAGSVGDGFGAAVSVGDDFLFVGAPTADGGASASGTAFAVEVITIGIFTDKGKSFDGTNGTPNLAGTGTLIGGDPFSFKLTNALENSLSALIIGFSEICVPFHLGVLGPSPDFVIIVDTTATGTQELAEDWPTGHGGPFPVYLQWWIKDAGGLAGWAASNEIEAMTPPG